MNVVSLMNRQKYPRVKRGFYTYVFVIYTEQKTFSICILFNYIVDAGTLKFIRNFLKFHLPILLWNFLVKDKFSNKMCRSTDKVKKNPHIFVSWRNSLKQNLNISGRNS